MAEYVVRVLVEGTIDKEFDYLVPAALSSHVAPGTIVRVELGGRRVGGWVTEVDVVPASEFVLKPIAKVTGWGPDADLIDLARWGARRWSGRVANLLTTASPPRAVTGLPTSAPTKATPPVADATVEDALDSGVSVLRAPPTEDVFAAVQAAAARGEALVVAPSVDVARHLAARLRRSGATVALYPDDWARARAGATVVGARAAAWAPMVDPSAFVLIDEHDEVHQEERVPTWNARDVLIERARRAGAPCMLISPIPTLEALAVGRLVTRPLSVERNGWPILDVADRRREDPRRAGLFSPTLIRHLQSSRRVVCVLNRKGRSRLLACDACGEIALCEHCDAAVRQPESDYVCPRCDTRRPPVCQACGATASRNIRAGVSRVREELEALAREPVDEVTASSTEPPRARVVVGTEAVLHQVSEADVVAFLDFDQELSAPRYRAAEQAMTLLVRAARLVGSRRGLGRIVLQTRQPDHEVIRAALHGDPERLVEPEAKRREVLGYPPFRAVADVSGAAAEAFIGAMGQPLGIEILGPNDGHWLVKASDHDQLAGTLAAVPRPNGRLRLEVDPLRI